MDFRRLIDIVSSPPDVQAAGYLREYLETQSYQMLLEDQRLEYLYKTYGEKAIPAAWERSKGNTPPEIVQQIEGQQGENEAQKIINYIASFDPSPNRQYAQWLVIRWLKNGYRLEDLPRGKEDIELFQRVKQRLVQKDINQYKTLADLAQAVAPFHQQDGQQLVPVSKRDEKRELYNRMSVPPEANIIYNDNDIKIIEPLTQQASCYWGENTRWCTAAANDNQFNYYKRQAPVYIVLIKALNTRYQFFFGGPRSYNSQFADEQDRDIDLNQVLTKYPVIFTVFGEEKFLPFVEKLGLHWFSQEATKHMSASQLEQAIVSIEDLKMVDQSVVHTLNNAKLGHIVHKKSDLKYIPINIQKDEDFQAALIQPIRGRESRTKQIRYLPEEYYKDHLKELIHWLQDTIFAIPSHLVTPELLKLQIEKFPKTFAQLPEEWRTTELAHLAVDALGFTNIQKAIPKEWQDEYFTDAYWQSRVRDDRDLHLKDLPQKYWTEQNIERCLRNHIKEIKNHADVLTNTIVEGIVQAYQFRDDVLKEIPKQFLTKKLFDAMKEFDKSYAGHNLNDYTKKERYKLYPSTVWDEETTISNMLSIKHFNEIAEDLQNNEKVVAEFIEDHPEMVSEIPDSMVTSGTLRKAFLKTDYSDTQKYKKSFTELAKQGLISDQTVLDIIAHKDSVYDYERVYNNLPNVLKTPNVMTAFAGKGVVPVKELTKPLQTLRIILRRLEGHPDEFKNVPVEFQNSRFALVATKLNIRILDAIPNDLLSEPILYQLLQHPISHHYDSTQDVIKKNFKRFPETLWSNRTVAAAIRHGQLEPSMELFEKYPSQDVANVILVQKPEWYGQFPKSMLGNKAIAEVARTQDEVLLQLDPSDITEDMAFAVIDGSGKHWDTEDVTTKSDYKKNAEVFEHMPRSVWSKRIYMSAVGRLVDLKDVPGKFRDTAMRIKAVAYHPKNVLAIPNPVHWLNTQFKDHVPKEKNGIEKTWREKMEKAGFVYTRKDSWLDVRKLEKTPLEPHNEQVNLHQKAIAGPTKSLPVSKEFQGYSVAVREAEINKRVYVFSPGGKFLFYLYSERGKVHFPYEVTDQLVEKYQPIVKEIVDEYFKGDSIDNINRFFIYRFGNNETITKKQLSKHKIGALEYTSVGHNKENRYEIFHNNKLILTLITDTKQGAYGNEGNVWLDVEKIYSYKDILEHGIDFARFISENHKYNINWQFKDFGVVLDRSYDYEDILTFHKLAEKDNLLVYTNVDHSRIGIFDVEKEDLVAQAKIKKNGEPYNIKTSSKWEKVDDKLLPMLNKAAEYAKNLKDRKTEV